MKKVKFELYEVLLSDNASFNVVNFHHLEDLKSISASSGAQREKQLPSLKIVRRWFTKSMCLKDSFYESLAKAYSTMDKDYY